jgi:DNA-binding GntR family transcriptional regulator
MVTPHMRRKPARPRRKKTSAPGNLTTRVTDAIRQSIVDAAFHESIVAAVEKGDLPAAEQLIDEHVSQMAVGFRAPRLAESPA